MSALMSAPRLGRIALVLGLGAGAFACGPSFQAIYEGNARFEHCYALEESAGASMAERANCWRDWSDHYTYGQTRDRVQYAIARYVALSSAPQAPTDEALMMAAPGVARVTTITAPAPTNADAPPPKILEMDGGPSNSATGMQVGAGGVAIQAPPAAPAVAAAQDAGPPPPPLPASECASKCVDLYRACDKPCVERGQAKSVCKSCEPGYKRCMRDCLK